MILQNIFRTFTLAVYKLRLAGLFWIFQLIIVMMTFWGCGGSGAASGPPPSDSGGTLPGVGGTGGEQPGGTTVSFPSVVSAKPEGNAVSVTEPILITFNKPMKVSSFLQALQGLNVSYEPICVDSDCRTIRFNRRVNFDYDADYVLELSTQIQDQEENHLQVPYKWSFRSQRFISPFSSITLDGITEDAGECTAIGMDASGTLHIVYYSDFEGRPKHAFCPSNCGRPASWSLEPIDHPDLTSQDGKVGRDINLSISGEVLHVSYRDLTSQPGMIGSGTLRYATGIRKSDNTGWSWTPVVVDDTDFGVTDTYIAVQGDRVHVSYRKVGGGGKSDSLGYATARCTPNCADPNATFPSATSAWSTVEVDTGARAGAPNHIVARGATIHLTYYSDRVLKYARCDADCAASSNNWQTTVVDQEGTEDVGSENSLAIDRDDNLHVTYRNSSNGDLKYAFCADKCMMIRNWQKVVIDALGAGSSQVKIDSNGVLHVSYRDDRNKDLKYATCPLPNCLNPNNWSILLIDAPGEVGWDTYLEVTNGTVHISYRDNSHSALKYAWGMTMAPF